MTEVKTETVQYAINAGHQIENIQTNDGKGKQVPPGGKIDIRLVTTESGEMFSAFIPEGRTDVPALMPISDPDFMDFGQPVTGPLVNKGKVKKKKKPFKLIKRKGSPKNFDKRKIDLAADMKRKLKVMFKSDIIALLKDKGIPASKSKTKNKLIDMYMNAQ